MLQRIDLRYLLQYLKVSGDGKSSEKDRERDRKRESRRVETKTRFGERGKRGR